MKPPLPGEYANGDSSQDLIVMIDSAHRAALRRVNRAIERLLSDFNLEPAVKRISPERLGDLPGSLRRLREQLAFIAQYDLSGCETDSEVMAYRRNLQRLQSATSMLQDALGGELHRITARMAETKAARSWSDLLNHISG